MTRGETRVLDELTHEWLGRWVSVSELATVVEKTAAHLYWSKFRLSRTYVRGDWYYRVIT